MANTRLQNLAAAIKASFTDTYHYFASHEWFNLEIGFIPKARLDDGYTLKYESEPSEFEQRTIERIRVQIEFVMNPLNDSYLEAIQGIVAAVAGLKAISFTGKKRIRINEEIWTTTLVTEEIILLTFPECYFEIGA